MKLTYLLEFKWFNESERTTSDLFPGGPEGWMQISYKLEKVSNAAARDAAIEIIDKTGYHRIKDIRLWRSVSFPMPDHWDNTEPDMLALAPAMITRIRPEPNRG